MKHKWKEVEEGLLKSLIIMLLLLLLLLLFLPA